MTHLVSQLLEEYKSLMNNGDERLKDWPLMDGPFSTITICLSYVLFVKYIGPQLMKGCKPFELRNVMIAYNILMVIASVIIVYIFSVHAWFKDYSFKCQPVDYSYEPIPYLIAKTSYFYFALKFFEFFDTIFFVLRKKFSHVSTLHVIHHGVMPFSVWWGLKFVPGGHATFFGFLNSFVHVIMYTYYALAAFGPHMHKYLWWKKYLTTVQMIQFILIFVHSMQLFFYDCKFPKIFGVWIGLHGVLFWFLFSHFYKKTYLTKRKETSSPSSSSSSYLTSSSTTTTAAASSSPSTSLVKIRTKNKSTLSYLLKFSSMCKPSIGNYLKLSENDEEEIAENDVTVKEINATNNHNNNTVNGHLYDAIAATTKKNGYQKNGYNKVDENHVKHD